MWGGGRSKSDQEAGRFDCSGFTEHIFEQQGQKIGTTTRQQRTAGKQISPSDMQPGDLVFFNTTQEDGHVGIYQGNGKWVGAQSSTGVAEVDMDNPYWKKRFSQVRRVS